MTENRNVEDDPMFGGIVKGSQAWHKHQQDIVCQSAGIDPDTGEPIGQDDD